MEQICSLLVAEDDLDDQLILEECLGDYGYSGRIHFVKNGKKVIDYLNGLVHDTELPRLIVLDLNMPILNGTQTLFELKQNARYMEIPVVIYSTSDNEHEKRKCMSFGAVDYLVKPISIAESDAMTKRLMEFLV
jgi:CheY-like chemotaxis protein